MIDFQYVNISVLFDINSDNSRKNNIFPKNLSVIAIKI